MPATVPASSAVPVLPYSSYPHSLNYNNGSNYDTGNAPNSGWAKSPLINVGAYSSATLTFLCNYQTETNGTAKDKRWVHVSNDNFATLLVDELLATSGGSVLAGACQSMGTWHSHAIPLDPAWGTVRVRFYFDTVDAQANTYAGWFVDDVAVVTSQTGIVGGSSVVGGGRSKKGWRWFHARLTCSAASAAEDRPRFWVFGIAILLTGVLLLRKCISRKPLLRRRM